MHTPVFADEALRYLNLRPGATCVDATADGGGHAARIAKAIQPGGTLIAIEWDEELFKGLRKRLKPLCTPSSKNCVLRRTSYAELATVIRSSKSGPVGAVLFDLGLSSHHLEDSRRGFSFQRDGPLDMRYSRTDTSVTAADTLERGSQSELEAIFKTYGEERFSRAIAKEITAARRRQPIRRTTELVELIRRATPARYHRSRIHFATRTFQALRIAVNHEFENIGRGLAAAVEVLMPGGRIVAIAFHHREDALIKNFFREPVLKKRFRLLTDPPLRPSRLEVAANPRSRSAILRAYEKIQ